MSKRKESTGISRSFSLITPNARRRYYRLTTARCIISLLDLLSLTLLGGLLAYLSDKNMFKGNAGIQAILDYLSKGVLPLQVTWLIVVLFVFTTRSVFSILISIWLSNHLASVESDLTLKKANELFHVDMGLLGARNRFELAYGLVPGLAAAVSRVLSSFSVIISEAIGLFSICIFLLVINPLVAAIVISYLGLVGWFISFVINRRAESHSDKYAVNTVNAIRSFEDLLEAQKEIRLIGSESEFLDDFKHKKQNSANSLSNLSVLGITPRYVMDLAIVFGIFLVSIVVFFGNTESVNVSTLALFATAGLRLGPSLLSIQGALSAMKMGMGESRRYFNEVEVLINENETFLLESVFRKNESTKHQSRNAKGLEVSNMYYGFPSQESNLFEELNLSIQNGSHVAIIGSSGSGKSTLADLILGLLAPKSGQITYNGTSTVDFIGQENSPFGYVPQRPAILSATIRDNVTLRKSPSNDVDIDKAVNDALMKAGLFDRISNLNDGLNTKLGDQGFGLSGGELQRLGVARALYSRPELLLLDEFTSSLDAATEQSVLDSVLDFAQGLTLIVIAHKLSTVREFDRIIVIEAGRIVKDGSPDDVLADYE